MGRGGYGNRKCSRFDLPLQNSKDQRHHAFSKVLFSKIITVLFVGSTQFSVEYIRSYISCNKLQHPQRGPGLPKKTWQRSLPGLPFLMRKRRPHLRQVWMRGAAAATKVVGSTGPIHSSLATSFGHPQADGYGLDFMTAMAVSDLGSQDFSFGILRIG